MVARGVQSDDQTETGELVAAHAFDGCHFFDAGAVGGSGKHQTSGKAQVGQVLEAGVGRQKSPGFHVQSWVSG